MVTTRSGIDTAASVRSAPVVLNMPFSVSGGAVNPHPSTTTRDAGIDASTSVSGLSEAMEIVPLNVVVDSTVGEASMETCPSVEFTNIDFPDEQVPDPAPPTITQEGLPDTEITLVSWGVEP
jgi:hypothetical protein